MNSNMYGAAAAPSNEADKALLDLLGALAQRRYRFITPTDATHRTVLRRPAAADSDPLASVFGWNRTFLESDLDRSIFELMTRGRIVRPVKGGYRSMLRVSSLDDRLFLHTGFPTTAKDSVFFGPDTYRFARFLRAQTPARGRGLLVDIGTGCGAGGILAAGLAPALRPVLADINPKALRLAAINARHAGIEAELTLSAGLDAIPGPIALAIANPPYIADRSGQTYQDGGDLHGTAIAADWAAQAMDKLAGGGRLLLYTGTAIIDGEDPLKARLARAARDRDCDLEYEEIDPDVFGEELRRPAYATVDRIAAVGAVLKRR